MKPKITDFVNCDQLLFSLSKTLIEVTINQWRDATLVCCLPVNWNASLNYSPVYSTGGESNQLEDEQAKGRISQARGGRTSQGANRQRGEKTIIKFTMVRRSSMDRK